MSIWVASNNRENAFQFFLLLKLVYKHGKMKLNKHEVLALKQMMGFKSKTPVMNLVTELKELDWIRLNERTGFYIIRSFDKLRDEYGWDSRVSTLMTLSSINNLNAYIGASLYTYLHKIFWKKVKREKSVRLKGCTYHFLSPTFNYKGQPAPIATTGVEALYEISKSKASRLKIAAFKSKLITLKKVYQKQDHTSHEIKLMIKYDLIPRHVSKFKGSFYLQSIDLITPRIDLVKRRSLGT